MGTRRVVGIVLKDPEAHPTGSGAAAGEGTSINLAVICAAIKTNEYSLCDLERRSSVAGKWYYS